ncbi:Peptidase family M23 [Sphingobacterium nematocida]|uniref:Peptidase family M23 n=1 Tax=Sphingobacterium nematocida TaxID=1513896 RepID=A0A1T5D095_9SPHI|nr:M23 family metallopeptidase [Sphingobacterium nematocida]SKB65142.1 Peptidase family M23 [Sphingobacterium nematocida]
MKFKGIVLASVYLAMSSLVFGQESTLKVTSKRNDDKSVDLHFEKDDPGTMTVNLKFKSISNSSTPTNICRAEGYSGTLLTLRPMNKDSGIDLSYSYRYIRGRLMPKFDKTFVYALPFRAGTEVYAREASFLSARYFGNTTPDDWKVYHFYTTDQQEVTASRKGVVVEIVDRHEDVMLEDKEYSSSTNSITIEHKDGTLLKYDGLSKGSIQVEAGETVFPGQVIGSNVKRGNHGYFVSFMLMYLKSAELDANQGKNITNSTSFYGFITPLFDIGSEAAILTKDKKYMASISPDLMSKEMSKKELKNYKGK